MSAYVQEHRERFGVEPICSALGVSASAFYQRATGARSARRVEDERLLARIREVHEANYCAYGYRRTWKALARAGEQAPRCRVQRLMRAEGIQGAKRRGKPWRTTTPDPFSECFAHLEGCLVWLAVTAQTDYRGFESMRLKTPSPASIIATIALFIALGGTAIAASHYLITSTSQIKPSVLKALRAEARASAAALPTTGVKAVIARVRAAAPTAARQKLITSVPLTGSTWTQHAEEVNELIGQVTMTIPSEFACNGNSFGWETKAFANVYLDGRQIGSVEFRQEQSALEATSLALPIKFTSDVQSEQSYNGQAEWRFEPGKTVVHTITATISDECESGLPNSHFIATAVSLDALAMR